MIAELSHAVLTRDIADKGLRAGDVGVVVHIHRDGERVEPIGYMLELFSVDGESLGTESVPADAVRPSTINDRMHVRTDVAAE